MPGEKKKKKHRRALHKEEWAISLHYLLTFDTVMSLTRELFSGSNNPLTYRGFGGTSGKKREESWSQNRNQNLHCRNRSCPQGDWWALAVGGTRCAHSGPALTPAVWWWCHLLRPGVAKKQIRHIHSYITYFWLLLSWSLLIIFLLQSSLIFLHLNYFLTTAVTSIS